MKKIGIIGSGVVGLCTAYYLNKAGYQVSILDDAEQKSGCSYGNAGMIVPSHIIPLASPGMIAKGIRWMFRSTSPFYVKPRLNRDLLKWGYLFYRHSNTAHVEKSAVALKELSLYSRAAYVELSKSLPFSFGFEERGLMMLYKTAETEKEETEMAALAKRHGLEVHVLSHAEVQNLEPDVRVDARGGIFFPKDAHLNPGLFVNGLKEYLSIHGVHFIHSQVSDFVVEQELVKVLKTKEEEFHFDEIVLATGSWSGLLSKKLQIDLPMQAGKGYSFTLKEVEKNSRIPSIFVEARVAVTPMGSNLRFGGTMEIGGINDKIHLNRVKGIVQAIPQYYPEMKIEMPDQKEIWSGLRPCSPDGLPYIGRSTKIKNLIIATGHSMMGISLAPGTGKLVASLLSESEAEINLNPFMVERF